MGPLLSIPDRQALGFTDNTVHHHATIAAQQWQNYAAAISRTRDTAPRPHTKGPRSAVSQVARDTEGSRHPVAGGHAHRDRNRGVVCGLRGAPEPGPTTILSHATMTFTVLRLRGNR